MKTNCSAPFQEELQAKRIGFGSHKISFPTCLPLILLIFFCSSGCSSQQPLFTRTAFPITYQLSPIHEKDRVTTSSPLSVIAVNNNTEINNRVVRFWAQGWYTDLFKKHHPVLTLKRNDLTILKKALNHLFRIYYLQFTEESSEASSSNSLGSLENLINCKPLTNTEIRFLLNSESENTFPNIPLTLLIISSHELLLQKGALAEYPRVQSPYLRQRLALPKLPRAEQFNLIATKKGNGVYSDMQMGFAICRNSLVLPD